MALVTGAGHGIGRAVSHRLAREGAAVVVADLDEAAAEGVSAELRETGLSARAVTTDVRSEASLQDAVAYIEDRLGRLDILVNNAAVFSTIRMTRAGFDEIPVDEWDDLLDTNLRGAWLACRAAVPLMERSDGGSIVNMGSASVFKGATNRVHYVASKAGMIGLTRSLARELGPRDVRVNCVAPGSTLSEPSPDDEIRALREAAIASRALKRLEVPDDVVGAVAFFASADSAFITGQTLVVDGGAHMA